MLLCEELRNTFVLPPGGGKGKQKKDPRIFLLVSETASVPIARGTVFFERSETISYATPAGKRSGEN